MNPPIRALRGIHIELQGERVALLPQRAIWWPRMKWLIVADLHAGKSEVYRQHGVAVPDGVLQEMLRRLSQMCEALAPERLVILGDLVHHADGIDAAVRQAISDCFSTLSRPALLVRGNHDTSVALPSTWPIDDAGDALEEPPFRFTHQPSVTRHCYTLAGHLHPTLSLASTTDLLRLPCFHFGPRLGVLPAFSRFSRGVPMQVGLADRAYVIADGELIEIGEGDSGADRSSLPADEPGSKEPHA